MRVTAVVGEKILKELNFIMERHVGRRQCKGTMKKSFNCVDFKFEVTVTKETCA